MEDAVKEVLEDSGLDIKQFVKDTQGTDFSIAPMNRAARRAEKKRAKKSGTPRIDNMNAYAKAEMFKALIKKIKEKEVNGL